MRRSNKAHNEKYVEKQLKQRKTQIFNTDAKVLYRHQNPHGHVPISHKIYEEHGYPKILQSDKGREKCFCKQYNIEQIKSGVLSTGQSWTFSQVIKGVA